MGPLSRLIGGLLLTGCPLLAAWSAPLPYRVERSQSVLAVITHPAGAVGPLGHSHLITAPLYRASLEVDEAQIAASRFQVALPVAELEVDSPVVATALEPRLRLLGLLQGSFPRLTASEMAATRDNMLSAGQLDAKAFPGIAARAAGIRREGAVVGGREFEWMVDLTLTVRGRQVTRAVPADLLLRHGRLRATALGRFRFSEFGIEPYRAALGLLQNADEFYVYVELAAGAEPATGEGNSGGEGRGFNLDGAGQGEAVFDEPLVDASRDEVIGILVRGDALEYGLELSDVGLDFGESHG